MRGLVEYERADDVTVVIPAWGDYADDFLARAIASVAAQRPTPLILVVDNASQHPIGSLHAAEVVRSDERRTIGAARNFGLLTVGTEYVLFWDADDVMIPGAIGHLRDAMHADEGLALAATRILEGPGTYHHWPRMSVLRISRWRWAFALLHAVSSLYPTTGSALMRTNVLRSAGGFPDVDEADDWVAGVSLALRGRIRVLDVPGRIYRLHPTSLSAAWTPRDRIRSARYVRERLRTETSIPGFFRAATPLLAPAQWFVLLVLRPLRLQAMARRRPPSASPPPGGRSR